MSLRPRAGRLLVAGLVLGCSGQDLPEHCRQSDVSAVTQSIQSSNQLTYNQLTYNQLTYNRLVGERLTLGELVGDSLALNLSPDDPLLVTPEGRELLEYTVRCAAPPTVELAATDDCGETHTFVGAIGLTPEWLDYPLTESGQRWLSGCLLAHVNAFGLPVPISIRDGLGRLGADDAERGQFLVQEAAFYGNLFTDPPVMYACGGWGLLMSEDLGITSYLQKRVCAAGEQCGFTIVGPCYYSCDNAETCIGYNTLPEITAAMARSSHACPVKAVGLGYPLCYDGLSDARAEGSQGFVEVVTTYLEADDAVNLQQFMDNLGLTWEEFLAFLEAL